MRYLLIACCLLSCTAFSQTQADYERVMGKFKDHYNANRNDSIYHMFADADGRELTFEWVKGGMDWLHSNQGILISYRCLGKEVSDPAGVTIFITLWSKGGQKTSSFSLDKKNKFETFRMITSSPEIDEMVRKAK